MRGHHRLTARGIELLAERARNCAEDVRVERDLGGLLAPATYRDWVSRLLSAADQLQAYAARAELIDARH